MSKTLKVLMINNFFTPIGGAEKVMMDEAELLQQAGHEVLFFTTDRKPYFQENPALKSYFPHYANQREGCLADKLTKVPKTLYNPEVEKKLTAALEHCKPDIVHIHNLHYHLTPAVLKALQKTPHLPVFMHGHDPRLFCPSGNYQEAPDFEGSCTTGNPITCLQKKCKHGSLAETAFSLLDQALHKQLGLYQRVDSWLCPSEAMVRVLSQAGLPKERFHHVPNFVDAEMLTHPISEQDDGFLFFFGRLTTDKGLDDLLKAMEHCQEYPLYIAGDGPKADEYRQHVAYQQKIGKLGQVEFLGPLKKPDLIPYIKRCRATVIPSRWYEPFGLTILESYAYGKPVIGTRTGGIPEVIMDKETGMLAERENPASLSVAIKELMSQPERARELGRNGRAFMEANYTPQYHLEKLLEHYYTELNKKPSVTL